MSIRHGTPRSCCSATARARSEASTGRPGPVGHDDLGGTAGAPKAAGDPVGYYVPAVDAHHVIYRGGDGHLHELFWVGLAPVQYGGNLTGSDRRAEGTGQPGSLRGLGRLQHRSLSRQRRAHPQHLLARRGKRARRSLRHRRHAEGGAATRSPTIRRTTTGTRSPTSERTDTSTSSPGSASPQSSAGARPRPLAPRGQTAGWRLIIAPAPTASTSSTDRVTGGCMMCTGSRWAARASRPHRLRRRAARSRRPGRIQR